MASRTSERSEVRYRRVLLSGKILLPGGGVLDCTLRNRSKRGASSRSRA